MTVATFTPRRHIYRDGDLVVPSVTQVLDLAGIHDVSRIPLHNLERGRAIGSAVHQACEFLDQQDLDLESIDPEIVGYVLAWQRFKVEQDFLPLQIEERGIAANGELKFGYCVDRVGLLKGVLTLVDIDSSSRPAKHKPIQTAGYSDALRHEGTRAAVHVARDGKYKVLMHEDEHDFEVWRAALVVAHSRLAAGARIR